MENTSNPAIKLQRTRYLKTAAAKLMQVLMIIAVVTVMIAAFQIGFILAVMLITAGFIYLGFIWMKNKIKT